MSGRELRTKELVDKWKELLEHKDLPKIQDAHRRNVTAVLLENQERDLKQAAGRGGPTSLTEAAPANSVGSGAGYSGNANLQGYDPVLISMLRRSVPNMIAFDFCGVQPMNGPNGMIFYLKSRYSTQGGTEALFNEADSDFSGTGTQAGTAPLPQADEDAYKGGTGFAVGTGEALGDGVGANIAEMAFSIERITVEAKTRKLAAGYTHEIAQDLMSVHGLSAKDELSQILSRELLAEMNREIVRLVWHNAVPGAQHNTANAGTFNLDTDTNGRWMVERFKGLMFQVERDANAIAQATRRGRGNVILCSSDAASALAMAGKLDVGGLAQSEALTVDDTGNTFVGVLNGKYKVFIDPYVPVAANNYLVVGYKGSHPYDAGLFYCPYIPLQMMQAVDPKSFQPRIGFQTRYGVKANPFAVANGVADFSSNAHSSNIYYRKMLITNLM